MRDEDTPTVPEAWQDMTALKRDICLTLAVRDGLTGSAINDALGRPASSDAAVNRRLQDLADEGLVERERDSDGRGNAKRNGLTHDGLKLVDTVVCPPEQATERRLYDLG